MCEDLKQIYASKQTEGSAWITHLVTWKQLQTIKMGKFLTVVMAICKFCHICRPKYVWVIWSGHQLLVTLNPAVSVVIKLSSFLSLGLYIPPGFLIGPMCNASNKLWLPSQYAMCLITILHTETLDQFPWTPASPLPAATGCCKGGPQHVSEVMCTLEQSSGFRIDSVYIHDINLALEKDTRY